MSLLVLPAGATDAEVFMMCVVAVAMLSVVAMAVVVQRWVSAGLAGQSSLPLEEEGAGDATRPHARRIELPPDALTCPICLEPMCHAAETVPCGHAFCGDCILLCWRMQYRGGAARFSGGGRPLLRCPIDRRPVDRLMPSRTLRGLAQEQPQGAEGGEPVRPPVDRALLDAELVRYPVATASDSPGTAATWSSRLRSWLPSTEHVWLLLILLYVISPYDLLPEAVVGAWGLVDDILALFYLGFLIISVFAVRRR